MSEFCMQLCQSLIRMELALAIGGLLVLGVFRFFPLTSPRTQRILCMMVLLQGCMWFRIPLTVPAFIIPSQFFAQPISKIEIDRDLDAFALSPIESLVGPDEPVQVRSYRLNTIEFVAIVCVTVWMAGIASILMIALENYRHFLSRLSQQVPCPSGWTESWSEIKQGMGVRQRVSLVVSKTQGPLLCWTPHGYQMVVPHSLWAAFSLSQRAMICRHELAHLQRGDLWTSLACHVIAVTHWMNPIVWCLVRHFDEAAEIACDEVVRRTAPAEACQYARALLCLGSGDSHVLFASRANGRHGLAERIRRLTSSNPRKDSKMKKWSVAALLMGITLANICQLQTHGEDASAVPKNSTVPKFGGFNPKPNAEIPAFGSVQLPGAAINFVTISNEKRTDAVVSVQEVLSGLKEFRERREQLKVEGNRQEQKIQELNSILQEEVRRAKEAGVEIDQKKVEEHHSKLLDVQNSLTRNGNEFYEQAYSKIGAEIEQYAKENGIRVVRGKQPAKQVSIPMSGPTIVGVASPTLVLHEAPSSRVDVVPSTTYDRVIKATNVADGASYGLTLNTTTLSADHINIVLTGDSKVEEISRLDQASEAKPEAGKKVDRPITIVHHVRPNVSTFQAQSIAQKEVIYAAAGDDLDITQAIIDRMNAKFEKNASNSTQK